MAAMSDQETRGKLFVSGGGNAEETRLLDFEFVKALSNGKLLYIPIGLQKDYIGYEECYEWITKTLTRHSRTIEKDLEIEMWIQLERKRFAELEKFDAVYIGGARNSYALMREFRETKFVELLRAFLNNGGNVYGGSTGAIILGKDISVFDELPPDDYRDPTGFGFLKGYSVFCHYKAVPVEKLHTFLLAGKGPVVAIPEKSGLIVQGNSARLIGFDEAAVFKAGDVDHPQELRLNECFTLI